MPNKIRIAATDAANEQTAFNSIDDRCLLYNRTEKVLKIKDNDELVSLAANATNNQDIDCEKIRVRTEFDFTDSQVNQVTAHPEWVANRLIKYCGQGNKIILLHKDNPAGLVGNDCGSSGEVVVTTYMDALSLKCSIYSKNGLKSAEIYSWTRSPKCKVAKVSYTSRFNNGKNSGDYWALVFDDTIYGNVYFTGWTTAFYEWTNEDYLDSDMTIITEFWNTNRVAEDKEIQNVNYKFVTSGGFFGEGKVTFANNFMTLYNKYDKWKDGPAYFKVVKASEADISNISIDMYLSDSSYTDTNLVKETTISRICGDENKPIFLDLSNTNNILEHSLDRWYYRFVGQAELTFEKDNLNPWEQTHIPEAGVYEELTGLYGLRLSDSATEFQSTISGNDASEVPVLCNLKNLQILKLPPKLSALPKNFLNNCPKIIGIDLPETITSIPTSGKCFNNCDNFNYIKVFNKTNVVFSPENAQQSPFTTLVSNLNFIIFVPIEIYPQYISAHSSNGWANHFVPY